MGNTEIYKLSPKTIIVIAKLVYEEHSYIILDLVDLNKSIRKLGISTSLNLDASFIYEVIRLNKKKFEDNTISTENLILPEKQNLKIDYFQTYSEIVTYYYSVEIESFSQDKRILENFLENDQAEDWIDIYSKNYYDKDWGDSEFIDSGIHDVNE